MRGAGLKITNSLLTPSIKEGAETSREAEQIWKKTIWLRNRAGNPTSKTDKEISKELNKRYTYLPYPAFESSPGAHLRGL